MADKGLCCFNRLRSEIEESGGSRGRVVANALYCDIVKSEFELQ